MFSPGNSDKKTRPPCHPRVADTPVWHCCAPCFSFACSELQEAARGGSQESAMSDLRYFLLGQSRIAQFSQFSSSSFSIPKGMISPHWQAHPRTVFVFRCSSQKGQHNIDHPHVGNDTSLREQVGMIKITLGRADTIRSFSCSSHTSRLPPILPVCGELHVLCREFAAMQRGSFLRDHSQDGS